MGCGFKNLTLGRDLLESSRKGDEDFDDSQGNSNPVRISDGGLN